jgi:O-antigen ligase
MLRIFLKFAFTSRRVLWLLILWQLIAVMLMALGVWPEWVVWVNLILSVLFVLLVDPFEALLFLIASIPFYVAVPNRYFSALSSWRLLFIWLFVVWIMKAFFRQRQYVQKLLHFRQMYREAVILEQSKLAMIWATVRRIESRFFPWDKYLGLFVLVCLLSIMFAEFPVQSIKQIIFLINVYLLYLVLINVTTTRDRVIDLIKYAGVSAGIIVALGYVQFIATLFASPYYFWQYWAMMVSKLYYGLPLANVLAYSNSWFSYTAGRQDLRMFSIMPDSHSFAMVAVFCIGFLLPLVVWYRRDQAGKLSWRETITSRSYYIWYAIRFSGFAVILSGTRGVWVGMLVPLVVSAWLYFRKFARPMMRKVLFAELLIILLFLLSPIINYGLNLFRVSQFKENFIDRAQSIYDLQEDSNVGRLIIWKDSVIYATTHPFGVGYGNFVVSLVDDIPSGTDFSQVGEEKNLRYNLPQKFVTAHSLYLNILVELGIVGLLVFVLFWWEFGSSVWRFVKAHKDDENIFTLSVVSITFTVLWFLGYAVFDVTLFNDKILMYFLIALGLIGIILRRYDSFEESHIQIPEHANHEAVDKTHK